MICLPPQHNEMDFRSCLLKDSQQGAILTADVYILKTYQYASQALDIILHFKMWTSKENQSSILFM